MEKKKSSINKTSVVLIVLTLALISAGIWMYIKSRQGTGQNIAREADQSTNLETEDMKIEGEYEYYGRLSPVDSGSASGEVGYSFSGTNFVMLAKFSDLDEPQEGYFYEGWLVKPDDGKLISTGRANSVTSTWVNSFSSNTDYTTYTKYVLTLEPDDGNPDPATHVLEGTLSKTVPEDATAEDVSEETKNGYVSLADYQANKAAYSAGNVVLFFNASWCPTCKVLNESLNTQADQFPDNLTVVNVDYDNSDDLKSKYGIKVQHTLVQVDADGNQISTWTGGGDLQSITDQLK
jgi:thiol-disulfide isomerase/thioredoxin